MTHFEYLESIGQISMFDLLEVPVNPPIEIVPGTLVKIDISNSDSQSVNYFRYYYPHVINKSGIVRDKKYISAGYTVYLIEVLGELHWMNENEVTLLE